LEAQDKPLSAESAPGLLDKPPTSQRQSPEVNVGTKFKHYRERTLYTVVSVDEKTATVTDGITAETLPLAQIKARVQAGKWVECTKG
jgi:hypothetical protein